MLLFGLGLFTLLALVWAELERDKAANRLSISLPSVSSTAVDSTSLIDASAAVTEGAASETAETVPGTTSPAAGTNIVRVTEASTVLLLPVYVTGAVNNPSLCYLPENALWQDAVNAAGGFTDAAAALYINLAAPIASHQMIYIPSLAEWEEGQAAPPLYPSLPKATTGGSGSDDAGSGTPRKISINNADAAGLTEIPGVGEKTAALIISHREENGPFESIEDLMKIPGIKEAKFAQMRDYVVP